MTISPSPSKPITIYIDADVCPVKQEIYRVPEAHALKGADPNARPYGVMAGLVPAIHDFLLSRKTWTPATIPGSSPGTGVTKRSMSWPSVTFR